MTRYRFRSRLGVLGVIVHHDGGWLWGVWIDQQPVRDLQASAPLYTAGEAVAAVENYVLDVLHILDHSHQPVTEQELSILDRLLRTTLGAGPREPNSGGVYLDLRRLAADRPVLARLLHRHRQATSAYRAVHNALTG